VDEAGILCACPGRTGKRFREKNVFDGGRCVAALVQIRKKRLKMGCVRTGVVAV